MLTQNFPPLPSLRTLHIKLWEDLDCQLDDVDYDKLREDRRVDFTSRARSEHPQFESPDFEHFSGCGCYNQSYLSTR
ncbi:hypothetical protein FRB94_005091 [Tulasnella sp. JGI-2019a]|nr:hypothetical protein FRB94_005091 [Tulasnella sp. JGI-2019a]